MAKCDREGCDLEAKKGQKYCCREHSPWGHLIEDWEPKPKSLYKKQLKTYDQTPSPEMTAEERIKNLEAQVAILHSKITALEVSFSSNGKTVHG